MKRPFTLAFALISATAHAGPVNINTATAEELAAELHGIGPVLAHRIVQVRTEKGAFQASNQMTDILGIGPRTLQRNAEFIRLD